MVHVEKLFKGSIKSNHIGHVHSFEIYAHMCKANERKALTLPTYNISSKKSRQQICHVDEQASTYTHSHTHDFWQKLFLAIQTECYIVLETK